MGNFFHLQGVYGGYINAFVTKELIKLLHIWDLWGTASATLVHSFSIEELKSVGSWHDWHRYRTPEATWQCSQPCFIQLWNTDFEQTIRVKTMNPPKELLGVFGCFFHPISVDQAHGTSLFGISFEHWLKSASVFWSAYCLRIRHLFHLLFSFLFTLKTVSMFQSPCWPVQLLLSKSQRLLHTGSTPALG